MREPLDASLKPRITHGRQREDLLDGGIDVAEAQTLLTDLGSHLDETQIDYIKKSLARHKPGRKVPQKIGAAAIAGLAIFGAFVGGERFNAESRRTNQEHDIRPVRQNTDLDAGQRSQLEAADEPAVQAVQLMRDASELRLKETEQKLQIAQHNADPAFALGTQVKKTEEKPQIARQNADLAKSQRSGVEAELRKAQEEKAQLTQQTSDLPDNQRSAKKGTDSANEVRSGRALTLDSRQNAEQAVSTQGFTAPFQSAGH
jgi:hypothetical protein